jgi:hypothetical protein
LAPFGPLGVYTARKHHRPTAFAVTESESAVADGGVVAGFDAVIGFPAPADTPPVAQLPVKLTNVTLGSQMKKSTVPVGTPSTLSTAAITA